MTSGKRLLNSQVYHHLVPQPTQTERSVLTKRLLYIQLCTCAYSIYVCMYIHFMHFALKLTAIEKASFVNVVKCSASGAQYMNLAAFFVIDLIYM